MTAATTPAPGARLVFTGGEAVPVEAASRPDGWLPAACSVVSPGTELRHLASTRHGPARAAGYMTISEPDRGGRRLLAPVPHGAPSAPDHPRAVSAPASAAVELVALARFQLIAALGLRRLPAETATLLGAGGTVLVTGSGPVALGCVLELRRLGAVSIRMLTRRSHPAAAELAAVQAHATVPPGSFDLVIDCADRPGAALEALAPGGTLGLLATTDHGAGLPAEVIHRKGILAIGMHELAGRDQPTYRDTLDAVLSWLVRSAHDQLRGSWWQRVPGSAAPSLFRRLVLGPRPEQPVLILDWSR